MPCCGLAKPAAGTGDDDDLISDVVGNDEILFYSDDGKANVNNLPGVTSNEGAKRANRRYKIEACLHYLGGGLPPGSVNRRWRELALDLYVAQKIKHARVLQLASSTRMRVAVAVPALAVITTFPFPSLTTSVALVICRCLPSGLTVPAAFILVCPTAKELPRAAE
jgi:hypothetical protein